MLGNQRAHRCLICVLGFAATVGCRSAREPAPTGERAPRAAVAMSAPPEPPTHPASDSNLSWGFDSDHAGGAPFHFSFGRTGSGRPGRWLVQADADAPSPPNVLAQLDTDATDYRFPIAVADAPAPRDLRLSVRCKAISGRVDQACGLVFRYRDENNYYLTRANALEGNVRLYYVKDGKREQIATSSTRVTARAWHLLAVEARADHISVFWNESKLIDYVDSTFQEAGRVGVWTKADSVTYFDDLTVRPLGAPGSP